MHCVISRRIEKLSSAKPSLLLIVSRSSFVCVSVCCAAVCVCVVVRVLPIFRIASDFKRHYVKTIDAFIAAANRSGCAGDHKVCNGRARFA